MTEVPERNIHSHDNEVDRVVFGIDTHTHTHKYVPVQGPRGPFFGLFKKHEPTHFQVKNRGQVLDHQKENVGE